MVPVTLLYALTVNRDAGAAIPIPTLPVLSMVRGWFHPATAAPAVTDAEDVYQTKLP